MAQPRSWRDEVMDAIRLLGGKAPYNEIYQEIQRRQSMDFEENPNWRAAVRQNIEMFSSDSDAFAGKEDIFYSVEGKGRGVWGLRPGYLKEKDGGIPREVLQKKESLARDKAEQLSDAQLKAKAEEAQTSQPKERTVKSRTYERNAYVSEYAKRRAAGRCQLCNNSAPFLDKRGKPFLETHHIVWLSKGGSDTIDNTVALCPNCHRKMHTLNRKEDVDRLLAAIR